MADSGPKKPAKPVGPIHIVTETGQSKNILRISIDDRRNIMRRSIRQLGNWILRVHGRRVGTGLTIAIILVPVLLATRSAQAQNWSDNFDSDPLGSNPPPGWEF